MNTSTNIRKGKSEQIATSKLEAKSVLRNGIEFNNENILVV